MKLHQEISVTEGQGPVPVKMTLDEIITAGKVTNPYQIFVLSWLSEFFKNGGMKPGSMVVGDPVTYGNATSSEMINGLKAMKPADQVALAEYLKSCVSVGECLLSNHEMSTLEWMTYVLHAQR